MGKIVIPDRSGEVLDFLNTNRGKFVNTGNICDALMLKRSGVYAAIARLRSLGYNIESDSRRGYQFISFPDLMLAEEIRRNLKAGQMGREIHSYLSLISTNNTAFKLAEGGTAEGTIVIAEGQMGGKGRMGRKWHSPRGKGIYFSLILKPGIPPVAVPGLTLAASLSVLDAVIRITGIAGEVKWPNDCLYNGRKFCGILTELSAETDRVNFIILGIGINVNQKQSELPSEIRKKATSLRIMTGNTVNRLELLKTILTRFNTLYRRFKKEGLEKLLPDYYSYASFFGREIRLKMGNIAVRGKAIGIDRTGAIIIETGSGEKIFSAGEISMVK